MLKVDVEGAPMGGEIQHQNPTVHVVVNGTAPIDRLSVIHDGHEVYSKSGGTSLECSYRVPVTKPRSYCYARILQRDGEMAWSSPVFIST
jgi:hypothetical protein